jgi:hypothetical protein
MSFHRSQVLLARLRAPRAEIVIEQTVRQRPAYQKVCHCDDCGPSGKTLAGSTAARHATKQQAKDAAAAAAAAAEAAAAAASAASASHSPKRRRVDEETWSHGGGGDWGDEEYQPSDEERKSTDEGQSHSAARTQSIQARNEQQFIVLYRRLMCRIRGCRADSRSTAPRPHTSRLLLPICTLYFMLTFDLPVVRLQFQVSRVTPR